ncbi:MAG: hypothetical protein ACOYKE_14780, partial [Ferruginibacter sp.]
MNQVIHFEVGQVWKFINRIGEEKSTLTILKVDDEVSGKIVHIRVDGISIVNPAGILTHELLHLPFSITALEDSVTELINQVNELPEFLNGYEHWKSAFDEGKAGVWKLPVHEVVEAIGSMSGV